MIPELTKPPYMSTGIKRRIKKTLKYLQPKLNVVNASLTPNCRYFDAKILDVGQWNYLTEAINQEFKVKVDNTAGDLDANFTIPRNDYNVIIYSHTIEHQFSPLHTLKRLKRNLSEDGRIYIFAPSGTLPRFLVGKGHYHEINEYCMGLLIRRAGLRLISTTKQRVYGAWWNYLLGVRPLLRLIITILSANTIIYEVKK